MQKFKKLELAGASFLAVSTQFCRRAAKFKKKIVARGEVSYLRLTPFARPLAIYTLKNSAHSVRTNKNIQMKRSKMG